MSNFLARKKKQKTLQRYSYKPCEHFSHLNKSWFYNSILKKVSSILKDLLYNTEPYFNTPSIVNQKIKPNHCYQACHNVITDLIG